MVPQPRRQVVAAEPLGESRMTSQEEARQKAAATYNAAADFYDDPANSFWDRYGRDTVARLGLEELAGQVYLEPHPEELFG